MVLHQFDPLAVTHLEGCSPSLVQHQILPFWFAVAGIFGKPQLQRTFGSGDQAVTLRLTRGGNTGSVDMVVAGPGIPRLPARLAIKTMLDPQGATQTASGYSMAIPGGGKCWCCVTAPSKLPTERGKSMI